MLKERPRRKQEQALKLVVAMRNPRRFQFIQEEQTLKSAKIESATPAGREKQNKEFERKRRSDRRWRVSHLVELVDVLDGLGEGGLELIELLLDNIAVTARSVTL